MSAKKIIPAMVWCGESPRTLFVALGHLRQGFYLFLKYKVMLKQIDTEIGKCWAVVFDSTYELENLVELKRSLLNLMATATTSDLFASSDEAYSYR